MKVTVLLRGTVVSTIAGFLALSSIQYAVAQTRQQRLREQSPTAQERSLRIRTFSFAILKPPLRARLRQTPRAAIQPLICCPVNMKRRLLRWVSRPNLQEHSTDCGQQQRGGFLIEGWPTGRDRDGGRQDRLKWKPPRQRSRISEINGRSPIFRSTEGIFVSSFFLLAPGVTSPRQTKPTIYWQG